MTRVKPSTFTHRCGYCDRTTTVPSKWMNTKVGYWLVDHYFRAWLAFHACKEH